MGKRISRWGLGIILLALSIMLFNEFFLKEEVMGLVVKLGVLGGALAVLGMVIEAAARASVRVSNLLESHHCARCSIVIPRGQTFCYRHSEEIKDKGREF
jgi:hypothetical protein